MKEFDFAVRFFAENVGVCCLRVERQGGFC